jgi:hypothetical protein
VAAILVDLGHRVGACNAAGASNGAFRDVPFENPVTGAEVPICPL